MKAVATFPGDKQVRLIDAPEPEITRPDQLKVKVLEVGVCGTDKEICHFDYGTPPAGSDHLIIGHESLSEVVEVGSDVRRFRPGDLVVLMVRRPCDDETCAACNHDRPDFCFSGRFTERGINQRHGYMTEKVVELERYAVKVPRHLREVGVLVEPLTIAEKALIQVWDVQERLPWAAPDTGEGRGAGHKAVVLGAGPVGLLGAMALRMRGFDTYVYSLEAPDSPNAKVVQQIGARYLPGSEYPLETLADTLGNIDLVYEATGASKASFSLLEQLGTNGVFIFTGVPGRKGPIELDADRVMRNLVLRNQIVYGTVNAGRDAFEAAIRDLQAFHRTWPQALGQVITGRYPIAEYQELLLGRPGGIKNVIAVGA